MTIHIETVSHKEQFYETVGNYWYDENGVLQIRVSDLGDEFMEKMVAIHEMVEEATTKKKGIPEKVITDFDLNFEEERLMGLHSDDEEPGFANDSPYLQEHTLATAVEMMMCAHAGVKWNEYEQVINNL